MKRDDHIMVTAQLPVELVEAMSEKAEQEKISRSQVMRTALSSYFGLSEKPRRMYRMTRGDNEAYLFGLIGAKPGLSRKHLREHFPDMDVREFDRLLMKLRNLDRIENRGTSHQSKWHVKLPKE